MFVLLWAVLAVATTINLSQVRADDTFSCCMAGWKEIRGLVMCPGPCCHGYEERVMDLPLLQRPSMCHKLSDKEMAQRRTVLSLLKESSTPNKAKAMVVPAENWKERSTESGSYLTPKSHPLTGPKMNLEIAEPRNLVEDQPIDSQKSEKAAMEFKDFLIRNKQLFIHVLSEGLSRKDLITGFEEFLKHMSSLDFQESRWF